MIEVITNIIGVFSLWICIKGCGSGFSCCCIPIHLHQRTLTKSVVINDVQNDSYTTSVTFIDQIFQHSGVSILFVQCHVEGRIIAPTEIAFKLLHRHQLYGCDAQALQIIQTVFYSFITSGSDKITH